MPPLLPILVWPLVSAAFFNKYTIPVAILITIFAGYLFLPHGTYFDLPLLPTLDKHSVPAISAVVLALLFLSRRKTARYLPGLVPKSLLLRALLLGTMISIVFKVLNNSDVLRYGPTVLSGMRPYDGFSALLSMLVMLLPLFLGRKFLADPKTHRLVIYTFVFGGLIYILPALFEVRMSPQLNRWIYGYFPHSWIQHARYGGWRPIVFLEHGLFVGLFFSMSVIAAVGMIRLKASELSLLFFAVLLLLFTLVQVKSLGALAIAVFVIPAALFLQPRGQMIFAATICAIFLIYPVLRSTDTFPVEAVQEGFARISAERAESLGTRLYHEDTLLEKAAERPVFGWGAWGRWRIYSDTTGWDQTLSDGYWVIVLAEGGWARYICEFGLLTLPVFLLLFRSRRYPVSLDTSLLCLLLGANIIDLVPNSGVTPLTWLISGALWGRVEWGNAPQITTATEHGDPKGRRTLYTARPGGASSGVASTQRAPRYSRQPPKQVARTERQFHRQRDSDS